MQWLKKKFRKNISIVLFYIRKCDVYFSHDVIQFANVSNRGAFVETSRIACCRLQTIEKVTLTKNAPHREVAFPGSAFFKTPRRGRRRRRQKAISFSGNLAPSILVDVNRKTRTKIGFRLRRTSSPCERPRDVPGPNKVHRPDGNLVQFGPQTFVRRTNNIAYFSSLFFFSFGRFTSRRESWEFSTREKAPESLRRLCSLRTCFSRQIEVYLFKRHLEAKFVVEDSNNDALGRRSKTSKKRSEDNHES